MSYASGPRRYPARLSVLLAREAPVGIIFKRGPTRWFQLIKWNIDTDTFEPGAWFKGMIYKERCDISPDGAKLIYFAMRGPSYGPGIEWPGVWTGISKVPWLTTLCGWPNGDTHFGGGLFETNSIVWVNQCFWYHGQMTSNSVLPSSMNFRYDHQFWDSRWHELFRLERDGWRPIQKFPSGSIPRFWKEADGTVKTEVPDPSCPSYMAAHIQTVHEKDNADASHKLIMTSNYWLSNPDSRTFELRDNQRCATIPINDITFADWDCRGRLVYSRQGKLLAADRESSGKINFVEIADFNSWEPTRTKSPDWARAW